MSITSNVHDYWNRASCGTDKTNAEKHSRQYFDQIEAFRYSHEPCIPAFACFSEWKDKEVLEVGTGAGTDFLQFVRYGARMHGVDLTEEAAENTRRHLEVYGLPVPDVRLANAEALPFENDHFDLVWSWGVIHHANDTEGCLREIARVTKPGGTCKVMIYNLNFIWAWTLAIRNGGLNRRSTLWSHMESFGTKAFTEHEARKMANRCGLYVQDVLYADQLIRRGARLEYLRRLLWRTTPARYRWYMMLDMKKR